MKTYSITLCLNIMKIANNITDLIGKTPLLRLDRYASKLSLKTAPLAKLEYFNPGGSVKDRVAFFMISEAEIRGELSPGAIIVEPTSGNTGVGLAMVAAVKGYRLVLTMPDSMSSERRALLAAYGADLVLTPAAEGMTGAIEKALKIVVETPNAVMLKQFENGDNPLAHYRTTANEIWNDTCGKVDVLVAGVGTGGTITGTARRLKELNANVSVVAVEPLSSPVLSGGVSGSHKIQGIGAGFIPPIYDSSLVDEVMKVSDDDAMEAVRLLARTEGVLTGYSSGAALWAAAELLQRKEYEDKNIVVVLPDNGERYLSTNLFHYEK